MNHACPTYLLPCVLTIRHLDCGPFSLLFTLHSIEYLCNQPCLFYSSLSITETMTTRATNSVVKELIQDEEFISAIKEAVSGAVESKLQ